MSEELLALLRTAVVDDVIYCMYCDHAPLEPDYDTCPICHKENPLKAGGFI